jgi:hypothetical protein
MTDLEKVGEFYKLATSKLMTEQEYLIECLRHLEYGGDPEDIGWDANEGICFNVWNEWDRPGEKFLQKIMRYWDEADPSHNYPVPAYADDELEFLLYYSSATAFYDAPKWEGSYGDARRDLCGFLADCLEKGVVG